ncbi:hypothetical protein GCK32_008678 [Trichostrongylus colubriformis]|uniref:Uncharacterized protein n=1 Tax=Trichostrongylus colubriformis TaxID=6319 RepID=A0AAN8IEL4_TRICO
MLLGALLRRASCLTLRGSSLPNFYRASLIVRDIPLRNCSSQASTKEQGRKSSHEPKDDPKEKVEIRKAYILGGCLMFMWLSVNGLLLYRRRNEYRALNKKLPPIPWEEFVDKYLLPNKVKTISYQPQFEVGNVYLHSATEQLMKKAFLDMIHAAPEKFSRPPDVRFSFEGVGADVEKAIMELQKATRDTAKPLKAVEFEVDQFPSYRELAFIILSTLFTFVAVSVAN